MAQQVNSSNKNNCNMVGLLGILIQIGLGVLSFSVLLIKRCRENPPRCWKVWLFDTSKQGVSQMLAHFINLTISIALTYEDSSSDQCLWYFTTNILDNTIGVLICVFCLVSIQKSLISKGKTQYISGNYYTTQKIFRTVQIISRPLSNNHRSQQAKQQQKDVKPQQAAQAASEGAQQAEVNKSIDMNQDNHNAQLIQGKDTGTHLENQSHTEQVQKIMINYKAWLVQLLIWISIVIIGKIILFAFEYGMENQLKRLSFSMMGWIEDYQVLQLMVVIVVVPVIMNGLAFWVQDNFLKKKNDLAEVQVEHLQQQSCQKGEEKYEIM